jgi:hypothetical protein
MAIHGVPRDSSGRKARPRPDGIAALPLHLRGEAKLLLENWDTDSLMIERQRLRYAAGLAALEEIEFPFESLRFVAEGLQVVAAVLVERERIGVPFPAAPGTIPASAIAAVKAQADLVDLIGRHVQLQRRGRSWVGLCPFHSEKTPSFHVFPEPSDPHWHCFGCREHGDVYDYAQRHAQCTFPQAVISVAALSNCEHLLPDPGAAS